MNAYLPARIRGAHRVTGRMWQLVGGRSWSLVLMLGLGRHPEEVCNRCGGANVAWAAPSPLWNEVMRGGDINGPWLYREIICPTCFAVLAEQAGVVRGSVWRFSTAAAVPLTTVTPSGRRWDSQRWLWVDGDAPQGARPVAEAIAPFAAGHLFERI